MKYFVIGIIVCLTVFGGAIIFELSREHDESEQIRQFIDTRGEAPVPHSWRGKIGKGI